MRTFTNFACDTTVDFGVSLLRFDSHPAEFIDRKRLLFGVDVIALLHQPADIPAFFDHELFELYHAQVGGRKAPADAQPGWWTLWVEGLATCVSRRMNPGLDAQQVLWYPKDMVARMQPEQRRAASLLLEDISKSGPDADRWLVDSASVAGLPPRQVHRDAVRFLSSLAAAPEASP
jgi:hypothetical protein